MRSPARPHGVPCAGPAPAPGLEETPARRAAAPRPARNGPALSWAAGPARAAGCRLPVPGPRRRCARLPGAAHVRRRPLKEPRGRAGQRGLGSGRPWAPPPSPQPRPQGTPAPPSLRGRQSLQQQRGGLGGRAEFQCGSCLRPRPTLRLSGLGTGPPRSRDRRPGAQGRPKVALRALGPGRGQGSGSRGARSGLGRGGHGGRGPRPGGRRSQAPGAREAARRERAPPARAHLSRHPPRTPTRRRLRVRSRSLRAPASHARSAPSRGGTWPWPWAPARGAGRAAARPAASPWQRACVRPREPPGAGRAGTFSPPARRGDGGARSPGPLGRRGHRGGAVPGAKGRLPGGPRRGAGLGSGKPAPERSVGRGCRHFCGPWSDRGRATCPRLRAE